MVTLAAGASVWFDQDGPPSQETLDWEASTLSFDPPTGTLTCEVAQG